ncbi:hypothetical protein N7519_003069, partial [Penicillium mononematosum]|uniref:uncharacterized protein n=1 Tax=Penicillium mononematosum TaxID=268346 RepID=UPI0025473E6C
MGSFIPAAVHGKTAMPTLPSLPSRHFICSDCTAGGVAKGARASTSTAWETLHPLLLLPSGGCALKATSTAPIFGLAGLDMVEKDDEATKSEPWPPQNPQQWNQYDALTESPVPSFHIQYSPEIDEPTNWYGVPAPPPESTRDTNAQKRDEEEDDVRIALRSKLNLITTENVHEDLAAINHLINDLRSATASYFILENGRGTSAARVRLQRTPRNIANHHQISKRLLAQARPINLDTESSSADYASDYEDQRLPQVADYLSMVGEARILAERLSELKTEYLVLIDQHELRERVDIPLASAALNSLLLYQDEKTKIETELKLARHTSSRTRDMQIAPPHFMPEKPEDHTYNDPLHSSRFEDSSPFFASGHPQSVNKGSFVNPWLLYRLRYSRVKTMRFKSAPELIDLDSMGWRSDDISKMAMMLWFQGSMEHIRSHSAG